MRLLRKDTLLMMCIAVKYFERQKCRRVSHVAADEQKLQGRLIGDKAFPFVLKELSN